jgi:hypothetical protein
LKNFTFLLVIILSGFHCFAQKYHLEIKGKSLSETKTIDSISYLIKHKDAKSLFEEITKTQKNLLQKGFLENNLKNTLKINDSSYVAIFDLGSKTSSIHIIRPTNHSLRKIIEMDKDTIVLPYSKIDFFLREKKKQLNAAGYPLATLQLTNITKIGATIFAKLDISEIQQKKINSIIITNTDKGGFKFPKGHLNQIKKKYRNSILSENSISKIKEEFDKYNFIKQTKYPETLFTKDSTKIYVYLEKQNSNNFDGFVGFNTNTNQKLTLSGYLNLQLENILNSGEEFKLNWKNNGDNQTSFNTSLEIPYIFSSPLGLKGQINIFKQDSTFQNTKTALEASYFLKYNTRIYIGRETTSSSDIQNSNNELISDFNSEFFTGSFLYSKGDLNNFMNPIKASVSLKLGIGKRENTSTLTADNSNKQNYIELKTAYTFYINTKNHFSTKATFHNLNSKDYGVNELYRFGGINSIRGFQENSLQAKTYFILTTEYRYLLNPNFYINTILDYGVYNLPKTNRVVDYNKNIISTGLGFSLLTKTGMLGISAVKNYNKEEKIDISNTLIHISYRITF